jgi:hypothetical protein
MSPGDPKGGHGAKLTRRQEQAIAALISAPSIAEAAQACGVSEKTLDRWLVLPEFAAAYEAARHQTLRDALQSLEAACTGAVAALVRVMSGEATPPATVVSAARSVLDYAMRGKELMELEDRIGAIEATIGGHRREP